jgi:hypothetical protein
MKKHATTLLLVMLIALPGLLSAQTTRTIKAQIPFEFVASGMNMSAGSYTINVSGDGQKVLSITNGRQHLFAVPNATESLNASQATSVLFHRYGDRYFLSGIKLEGWNRGYVLPAGRVETELQAKNAPESEVILLASAQ